MMNCSGGQMPWGAWITCEETVNGPDVGPDFTGTSNVPLTKPHGYVFEVPTQGRASGEPVTRAGRFAHEAVSYDPREGVLYLTEDNFGFPSGFYRYKPRRHPARVGRLDNEGRLQMLAVKGMPNAHLEGDQPRGARYHVEWVDIDDPDPTFPYTPGQPAPTSNDTAINHVGDQGRAQGAAGFSRLEGQVHDKGTIYFTSTQGGGPAETGPDTVGGYGNGFGQVWAYETRSRTLRLVYQSPGKQVFDFPDNITVSDRGTLVVCEDNNQDNYVRALSPRGQLWDIALNRVESARTGLPRYDDEFAGSTFSPDGSTLFVNIQASRRDVVRHLGALAPDQGLTSGPSPSPVTGPDPTSSAGGGGQARRAGGARDVLEVPPLVVVRPAHAVRRAVVLQPGGHRLRVHVDGVPLDVGGVRGRQHPAAGRGPRPVAGDGPVEEHLLPRLAAPRRPHLGRQAGPAGGGEGLLERPAGGRLHVGQAGDGCGERDAPRRCGYAVGHARARTPRCRGAWTTLVDVGATAGACGVRGAPRAVPRPDASRGSSGSSSCHAAYPAVTPQATSRVRTSTVRRSRRSRRRRRRPADSCVIVVTGTRPRVTGSVAARSVRSADAADPAGECRRRARRRGDELRPPGRVDLVAGEGHGHPRDRVPGVVQDGVRHRRQPGADRAVLDGVPPGADGGEHAAQLGDRGRPVAVALDEAVAVRVERPDLRGGQRGEHRQAARREGGREAHPDVGDEGGPAGCPLLDDVEDVAAVQDGEVGVVGRRVDEPPQDGAGDPLQRRLALVGRARARRPPPRGRSAAPPRGG